MKAASPSWCTVVSATASVGAVFAWLEYATRDETGPHLSVGDDHAVLGLYPHPCLHSITRTNTRHGRVGGGSIFPRDPEPDYWDFVYLAFSIGTATRVSDVDVSSKRIRRTVTVHDIVAFFFNVTVIALTVGLVGDAVQN
jgi:hypothetical protein